MFVVESVAADIDDGGEGDLDVFVGWRDAGEADGAERGC